MVLLRCIVMGAGVSGILMTIKLKQMFGPDVDIRVFEKNADIGGTWFENRYPGCACDVPSHIYQYSFAPNPYWSKIFASSAEIQQYLVAVVRHYELQEYIACSNAVTKATWNETDSVWIIEVNGQAQYECDVFINAGGIFNNPHFPALKNINNFEGPILHTAAWNSNIDLTGKRVAIVGGGASSIQLLPAIRSTVAHADMYIRTPSWIAPLWGVDKHETVNRAYTEEEISRFADQEYSIRQRKTMEDGFNKIFKAFSKTSQEQKDLREQLESSMKKIVKSEDLQKRLIPDFEVGCRRTTPGEPYLHALQESNVEPVFDTIEEITTHGICAGGRERHVDAIILATGFNTSFRPRFPITARGRDLSEVWKDGPVSYLGIAVSGFPNYLTFLGPNTPISNGSLIGTLEATADHFIQLLVKKVRENIASFDVRPEAQDDFDRHTRETMKDLVWTGTCRSWYKNVQGKITAVWPGSSLHYREVLASGRFEDFEWKYRGNRFSHWKSGLSHVELGENPDFSYYILPYPNLPPQLFGTTRTMAPGVVNGAPTHCDDDVLSKSPIVVRQMEADIGLEVV